MVISSKHRYVFVQSMKTASTAIAAELCEVYDGQMILHKHASIDDFMAQASDDEKQYFSFAGVRNPLDVVVSRFELRKSGQSNGHPQHERQKQFIEQSGGDFNAFFEEFVIRRRQGASSLALVPAAWRDDSFGNLDYVYRYENVQEEFSAILKEIGIEQARPLRARNQTRGKDHFLGYYNEANLRAAYLLFYDYLSKWGYPIPTAYDDVLSSAEVRSFHLQALGSSVNRQHVKRLSK